MQRLLISLAFTSLFANVRCRLLPLSVRAGHWPRGERSLPAPSRGPEAARALRSRLRFFYNINDSSIRTHTNAHTIFWVCSIAGLQILFVLMPDKEDRCHALLQAARDDAEGLRRELSKASIPRVPHPFARRAMQ